MRELFIRESEDRKVKMTGPIALIIALLFLIVFAGCSPAEKPDAGAVVTPPAVTDSAR